MTVDGLRRRRPEALGELLEAYGREIQGVAYLILRDVPAAEDVTIDTLLTAFERGGQIRDERALRAWLLRVATNHALGLKRKSARVIRLDVVPERAGAEDLGTTSMTRVVLLDGVARLPIQMRAALVLRYYADLSVDEVAAVLGKSPNTIKAQLQTALDAFASTSPSRSAPISRRPRPMLDDIDGLLRDALRQEGDGIALTITPAELERRLGSRRSRRRTRRLAVLAAAIAVIVVGSVGALANGWLRLPADSVASQPSVDVAETPAPTAGPTARVVGMPDVPVDPSLEAVSRSNPTPEAKAAMDMCVREGELDRVAGMAQLPARDLRRFTLTNGNEPELQTDALVWAIQFEGVDHTRGFDVIDPLCVVIEGSPMSPITYAPYGHLGETFSPPAEFVGPFAALPPLAP